MTSLLEDVSNFDHFTPQEYLNEYYHSVFSENDRLLDFFARAALEVREGSSMLEYGGGPTIYQLISFAPRVSSIHFTDFLDRNIGAVQNWMNKEKTSHNWTPFVEAALAYESGVLPKEDEVRKREDLVRAQLKTFGHVDALDPTSDTQVDIEYDLVSVNFVPESISKSADEWQTALRSIAKYVMRDGILCMTAIRNAVYWLSGGKQFPAHPITADMLREEIETHGFIIKLLEEIDAEVTDRESSAYEGYDGMVFLLAVKK